MADAGAQVSVGCAGLPPRMSFARYFRDLRFLEVDAFFTGTPSEKAVRGWKKGSPDGARFALVAPRELTHPKGFASPERAGDAIDRLASAAAELSAEAILFRTPGAFSPSAAGRDAVRRFFAEVASGERFVGAQRVWAPEGLWDPELVARLCGEFDILAAVDPLANDPLGEEAAQLEAHLGRGRAYFRIRGLGRAQRRYSIDDLEQLAEVCEQCERAWVAFANPNRLADARALQKLLTARA